MGARRNFSEGVGGGGKNNMDWQKWRMSALKTISRLSTCITFKTPWLRKIENREQVSWLLSHWYVTAVCQLYRKKAWIVMAAIQAGLLLLRITLVVFWQHSLCCIYSYSFGSTHKTHPQARRFHSGLWSERFSKFFFSLNQGKRQWFLQNLRNVRQKSSNYYFSKNKTRFYHYVYSQSMGI